MPAALLRPCPHPHCPTLTEGGPCAIHAKQREQQRGTSSERGYDARWRRFRTRFVALLVAAGVAPVCGASLPGGPDLTRLSACKREGRLNDQGLHLHHEPPLTDAERQDWRKVCDPLRVGFACETCHNRETGRANA